jgi:hypothetical protein
MHIMTGEAKTPMKWEEAGWAPPAPQLASINVVFEGDTEDFIQQVVAQHYILAYGDIREELTQLCRLQGIRVR